MHCWWECKLVQLWKTVWRLLKILKVELTYYPEISLLGIYLKSSSNKSTCISMFIAALFTTKLWKQTRCPTNDEWIFKFRRPKVASFLSYVEYRPITNTAILYTTGYIEGRSHMRGEG
jgi:hypothetical protein